ncbi:MAG TPA: response regulator transcription factor [Acidimicrobiales bacterium]|nr:response regulator transcription factor [Acidimicrobiales bacterium]
MTLAYGDLRQGEGPDEHPLVLVVDEDPAGRDALGATLSLEGLDVVTAAGLDEGLASAAERRPSLVLLAADLADPDHGLGSFRRIDAALPSVPVIVVTPRDDEVDAVLALEAGAADHLTKPLRPREATARVRAVLRRVGNPSPSVGEDPDDGVVVFGPVCMDTGLREATVRGRPIELSRKEFDLLALLVLEAGHVVTRAQCMDRIWRDRRVRDSRTLDTHVKRLRKKVERDPAEPEHIITVRGIGYRFKP